MLQTKLNKKLLKNNLIKVKPKIHLRRPLKIRIQIKNLKAMMIRPVKLKKDKILKMKAVKEITKIYLVLNKRMKNYLVIEFYLKQTGKQSKNNPQLKTMANNPLRIVKMIKKPLRRSLTHHLLMK